MGHGGTLDQRTNLTKMLAEWPPIKRLFEPGSGPFSSAATSALKKALF
jgi:hypothetical protein